MNPATSRQSLETAFRPVKTGRIFEAIADQIKQSIFNGELNTGDKLPTERELAQIFNTSRVTVRSALHRLEHEGLLDIRAGSGGGFFVKELGLGPLQESFQNVLEVGVTSVEDVAEVRAIIEPQAARLAALRAGPEDLACMEESIRELARRNQRGGPPDPTDLAFHVCLAKASGNPVLLITCQSLASVTFKSIAHQSLQRQDMDLIVAQRRSILKAVGRKEPEAAEAAMLEHVHAMRENSIR